MCPSSAQLRTDGHLFAEDIVLPAGTYTAGGYVLTVTKCGTLLKVRAVTIRGPTGTTQTTSLVGAPVVGSESSSANTFSLKLYGSGTASATALVEIAAGSALGEALTASVIYEGLL